MKLSLKQKLLIYLDWYEDVIDFIITLILVFGLAGIVAAGIQHGSGWFKDLCMIAFGLCVIAKPFLFYYARKNQRP